MALQTKTEGNFIIVYLTGRMDVHLSAEVEKDLNDIISSNAESNILLNLADVEYMSSSGLRVFVATMRQLKQSGRTLRLCSLNYAVKKVFEVVELMDMFEIFKDEQESLEG